MAIDLGDYVDVAARMAEFREKYPKGSLQPNDRAKPFEVLTIGSQTFIVYVAAAYRGPDDEKPGVGAAYEEFPGRTPYTKGSELQNAETSAWGRAIVAALAADTKRGISSAEEVRNRRAEQDTPGDFDRQGPPAEPTENSPIGDLRGWIKSEGDARSLSVQELAEDFHKHTGGQQITDAAGPALFAYWQTLRNRATPGQHKQLPALWKTAEISDEKARLEYMSEVAGRRVESVADLTKAEAATLIGKLTAYVGQAVPA